MITGVQARQVALKVLDQRRTISIAESVKELSYKDSILYMKIEGWIWDAVHSGEFVISFPREQNQEIPPDIIEILDLLGYSIHTTENKIVIKW